MAVKKTGAIVDNLSPDERQRLQLIRRVQEMLREGFTYSEIAGETGVSTRTIARYRTGDPESMCHLERPGRHKLLDSLKEQILQFLQEGYHASGVYTQLVNAGYDVHKSTVRRYAEKLAKAEGIDIYKNHKGPSPESRGNAHASNDILLKRTEIQRYLWLGEPLPIGESGISILYERYPAIFELKKCISEFREIFHKKSMPLLYLFIEKYKGSSIAAIKSFATGLERDINAVENAVASELSNGFVEGNNSRVKAVKRCMYGRCGLKLLSAKIMLGHGHDG